MKLDSLVGDIEDAVTSVMNRNLKRHSIQQYSEVVPENNCHLKVSYLKSYAKG